jgi:predicted nucleic acid-binding protein
VETVDDYLLDNNIISILARPSDPRYPGISADFQSIRPGSVFLPVIALAEIEFGMMLSSTANEAQKKDLRDFFTQYPLHFPIDDNTVEPYAMLRAQLWRTHGTRKGRGYREKILEDPTERVSGRSLGIDERDLLIASIAVQYNLVLATNDRNRGMQRLEESARQLEVAGAPVRLRLEYWPKRR